MAEQFLKYLDTRPSVQPLLRNPDGVPADLTTALSITLVVHLGVGVNGRLIDPADLLFETLTGTPFKRVMLVVGNPLDGVPQYDWVDADWTSTPGPALVRGRHRMEYEVVYPGGVRITYPNDGYDVLTIGSDLGQG